MDQARRIEITKCALIGQAVGDAFGVPVEFLSREQVQLLNLQEMIGADSAQKTHSWWGDRIPKGSWSDDTSMAVASMASFIECRGKIDYEDQMSRFVRWWSENDYCCLDYSFGLGGNVSSSLIRFMGGTPALQCGGKDVMDNGNGALMRILPFSLYCIFHQLDMDETVSVAGNGSAITHGHEISRMCCFIWTEFLRAIVERGNVSDALAHIEELPYQKWFSGETMNELKWITEKKTSSLTEQEIHESGYVVDTLYAALYSLSHAEDYETSIRNAVNLGYDTDTTGAVTGMAAGILYGMSSIPERWLNALRKRNYLETTAKKFALCID